MKAFKGKYVLTSQGLEENKMIVTSDGIIKDIGSREKMKKIYNFEEIIGDNHLIIPGFVNLHTHVAMRSMLGYGEEKNISTWLNDYIWPLENKIDSDDIYWSSLLGILELLKSGTTTIVDHYFHADKVAEAAKEAGIRGILAETLMDLGKREILIKKGENFIKNYEDESLIEPWIGPHATDTCSKELLKESKKVSNTYNTGIHIHLSQSKDEVRDVQNRYGKTPTEFLKDQKILGPNTLAAHGIHLTEKEIKILGNTNSSIAHCAISLSKLDGEVAPIKNLINEGVTVGIGNDCFTYDMFPELLSVGILNKNSENDPKVLPAKRIFKMATVNGAKAVKLNSGEIKVGNKADFVLLNPKKHLNNIYSELVYLINQNDVEYTIVNGEVRYRKGEFPGINKDKIYDKVKKINKRLIPKKREDQ